MVDKLISELTLITDPAVGDFVELERANSSASPRSTIQNLSKGIDHGLMVGLGDDDHLVYVLGAGRTGGQIIKGGLGSGDDLLLESTAHATKGHIALHATTTCIVDCVNNRIGFGNATPQGPVHIGFNDLPSANPSGISDGSSLRFGKELFNANGAALIIGGSCGVGAGFLELKANNQSSGSLIVSRIDGELTDNDLCLTVRPKNITTGYGIIRSLGEALVLQGDALEYDGPVIVISNFVLGTNLVRPGTSSSHVLAIGIGTPPSTAPADLVQLYCEDFSGATTGCLKIKQEGGAVIKLRQQAKANFNNWSSQADIVAALVAMGLFDAS